MRGQAIVELGVMGAILIFLIGVLISYALRSNYQQRVNQMAFRRAMASAAESSVDGKPLSVGHTVIRDRYIPDPSGIFGTGPVNPFSSSASVTRNCKQDASAQDESELPLTRVDIQGMKWEYTSGDFLYVSNVTEDEIEDYYSVFGQSNVFAYSSEKGKYVEVNDDDVDKTCAYYGYYDCALWSYNTIRILDNCKGEVYDYGSCYQQCRDMDGYSGITRHGKPSYCGSLNDQDMVSQSYTQDTRENNRLQIDTGRSAIGTTDNFDWSTTTNRTLQPQNADSETVSSTVGERRTDNRQTPW
jgi:hypothetical protein